MTKRETEDAIEVERRNADLIGARLCPNCEDLSFHNDPCMCGKAAQWAAEKAVRR